jgi:hypothetical protein
MPELSRFYGIIIRMFYGDHAPPHFHAVYQGEEIKVNINTLEVMEGDMSRRAGTRSRMGGIASCGTAAGVGTDQPQSRAFQNRAIGVEYGHG